MILYARVRMAQDEGSFINACLSKTIPSHPHGAHVILVFAHLITFLFKFFFSSFYLVIDPAHTPQCEYRLHG